MRVVIDLQAFPLSTTRSRIIDYSVDLARTMLQHADQHEVEILVSHSSDELVEDLQRKIPSLFNRQALHISRIPFLDATDEWHRMAAELVREHAIAQLKPDVVLCAPLTGPVTVLLTQLRSAAIPTAIALPAIPGLLVGDAEEIGSNTAGSSNATHVKHQWQCQVALIPFEHCRQQFIDALELPPDRVVVVPPGTDKLSAQKTVAQAQTVLRRLGVNQDFILSLTRAPGLEQLVEAFALLPDKTRDTNRLVLAGADGAGESHSLAQLARSHGLTNGEVVVAPGATDDELAVLFKACKLLVITGSNYLDARHALTAMTCGTPILGQDHTDVAEILGTPKAIFSAVSARALSDKIHRVLASTEFRDELKLLAAEQAQRFSWQATARRVFDALEQLSDAEPIEKKSHVRAKERLRMAYVSPLPPERSGIADYSAELLPELAKHYEIELITDLEQVADSLVQREFRRVPFQRFQTTAHNYQRIIYHVGNSPFHAHVPALIERYPGTLVLHDFFLSHLFKYLETLDGVSLWRNLYMSHGYPGLLERARKDVNAAIWAYPCSLAVLSHATGVIVHSSHARELVDNWFGIPADHCRIIPQLRTLPARTDRHEARRILGIPPDLFLVCSFGFLSPAKLNDLLFRSWQGSILSRRPNCLLVFVGGDGEGAPYKFDPSFSSQIRATGYLSKDDYELYLAAADVGVQLRGELSRGETPRSVLDCMAHGVAAVVSAHPALSDLPSDSVVMLSERTSIGEIIAQLERLHREPGYRDQLGRRAQQYIQAKRNPAGIAQQYAQAIEEFARDHPVAVSQRIAGKVAEFAAKAKPPDAELGIVASCFAEHHRRNGARQLLVDITVIASLGDIKTGIHRTTRGILNQLLHNPPPGWRVEPVFRRHLETYRYARNFVNRHLGVDVNLEDAPVAVNPGDVFLGLDWDPGLAVDDGAAQWLVHHRQRGMRTIFTIYDLLPVYHSEWFKPDMQPVFGAWLARISQIANGFACISRAVADDLVTWLDGHSPAAGRLLDIGYFHLGDDIEASSVKTGLTPDDKRILDTLKGGEILLMVGTVEPRKGHSQALSAMEQLWAGGEDLKLVICGREGWIVEPVAKRLRSHPELGRRLFWIEEASDDALLKLYSIASAMLMASEGEGFGLPLVEAARHGVPIITRDLKVFREVAGEHAFYFSGVEPVNLATALRLWLELFRRGEHPTSSTMPRLNWYQSTEQLLQFALHGKPYKQWRRTAAFLQQPAHKVDNGHQIVDDGTPSVSKSSNQVRRESAAASPGMHRDL